MDKQQQEERLTLSVPEVARLLGLSRGATYEAVRAGQIPSIRIWPKDYHTPGGVGQTVRGSRQGWFREKRLASTH